MNNLDRQLSCEDTLGRTKEAKSFANFLTKEAVFRKSSPHHYSHVTCVSAGWGQGKTVFLKLLGQHLKQNHFVFYFDAWSNDFSEDALTSLFSEFAIALEEFVEDTGAKGGPGVPHGKANANSKFLKAKQIFFKSAAPVIASHVAKKLTGLTANQINRMVEDFSTTTEESDQDEHDDSEKDGSNVRRSAEEIASKIASSIAVELTSQHKISRDARFEMKRALEEMATGVQEMPGYSDPLFVLVDELDRCRPDYAINLLESIKHLFTAKDVVYVIATNIEQLCYSISAVYGERFDSHKYLKRFFDNEYRLKSVDKYRYAKYLMIRSDYFSDTKFSTPFTDVCLPDKSLSPDSNERQKALLLYSFDLVVRFFDLELRDIDQVFSRIRACAIESELTVDFFLLAMLLAADHIRSGMHRDILDNRKRDELSEHYDSDVTYIESRPHEAPPHFPEVPLNDLLRHYSSICLTRRLGSEIQNDQLGKSETFRRAAIAYRDSNISVTMYEFYVDLVERLQRFSHLG